MAAAAETDTRTPATRKGTSPMRQFRAPDPLWGDFGDHARSIGMSASERLRYLMRLDLEGKIQS